MLLALRSRGGFDDVEAGVGAVLVTEEVATDVEDVVILLRLTIEVVAVALFGRDELLGAKDGVFDVFVAPGPGLNCEVPRIGSGVVESKLRRSEGHLGRSGLTAHWTHGRLSMCAGQKRSGNRLL